MPSFLERLHSASIFGNPFSPPRQEDPMGILDQFISRLPTPVGQDIEETYRGGSNLQRVGQRMQNPIEQNKPMDVVYKPSISEQIGQKRIADIVHPDPELPMKRDLLNAQLGLKRADLGIRQQRANVYQFKAENPDAKIIQGKDGVLRGIDPRTLEVTELDTTGMSEQQLADMTQENAIARIKATGKEAEELEGVRQPNRIKVVEATGEQARKTRAVAPGGADATANLPTQRKTALQVKMNTVLNQHPEWRSWVSINDQGFPEVAPAASKWYQSGPDEATRNAILDSLGMSQNITSTGGYTIPTPAELSSHQPTTPATPPKTQETPDQRMARLKKAAGVK